MFHIFYLIISFHICLYLLNVRKQIPVAKTNSQTSSGSGSIVSDSPSPGIQGNDNQPLPYTVKRINGMKNFECNVCSKTFSQLSNINAHVRTHTGERPFKCKICKKRFTQMHHLKSHIRVHTGERPFSCQDCGKRFKQSSTLQMHLRVHTGEKPFKCQVCSKSFTKNVTLKSHMRMHTAEKPSVGCQKKFIGASKLRSHWNTSNCEPSSLEERPLSDLIGSDVEGNCICQTISTRKLSNVRAGMEDTNLDGLRDWSQNSSPKKRNGDFAKRMPVPYSKDSENGDPRVKHVNGIVKRYGRQSAQEAAKRLKRNFAVSSRNKDDEWSEILMKIL